MFIFFFKQKTAYEMRISDWSSDVCSSDLTCASAPAFALGFDLFDGDVIGHFNTTASIGAAIRTESQSANLLGKGNLSPTGCSGAYQTCQGDRKSTRLNSSH